LALFPTLEDGLSPELYEEIVDILDPDLIDIADGESTPDNLSSHQSQTRTGKIQKYILF
jgi:hypothetical protein